jgi:hypothetical protein
VCCWRGENKEKDGGIIYTHTSLERCWRRKIRREMMKQTISSGWSPNIFSAYLFWSSVIVSSSTVSL